MFNVGPLELIVVLIIALLVLGPSRLPEVARSVGRGLREFRGAIESGGDDDEDEPPASPQAAPVAAAPAAAPDAPAAPAATAPDPPTTPEPAPKQQ